MRVLLAPSAFAPLRGGVEEAVMQIALSAQSAGHDVSVVTNRWPHGLPTAEHINGLQVLRLPFTLPGRRPSSIWQFQVGKRQLQKDLMALPRPDVVNIHCLSGQLHPLARFARSAGIPLVLSTHGETVMDAQGVYDRSRFLRQQFRTESARAAALTACSTWTRDRASELAPSFGRATVITNGIRAAEWRVSPLPVQPAFCAWGRMVPQKGFDLLLAAFSIVRAANPAAQLLIGGSGPELASLRLKAPQGVTFLGALDREGVQAMLDASNVAVVPSRVEPFGIVALEALACGRGLVRSSSGGLSEAAGGLGRGVNPLSPPDLAQAMLDEYEDPVSSSAGRSHALAQDWSNQAARYIEVWQDATRRPALA